MTEDQTELMLEHMRAFRNDLGDLRREMRDDVDNLRVELRAIRDQLSTIAGTTSLGGARGGAR